MRGTGLIARLGEADVQLEVPEPQVQDSAAAQWTMNARRMMTRITTTNQKKNTTIPGIAYPATVLALATDSSYPAQPELSAIAYGASPDGSAAASASQFRSACSSGSPLVRKVRRAALFTLLIVDLGSAATTVTSCGTLKSASLAAQAAMTCPGSAITARPRR